MIMISTGLRRNELVNIKCENIDLTKKRVYLEKTKTANQRYIYLLDQKSIDIIKDKLNDNEDIYFQLIIKNSVLLLLIRFFQE